MPCMIIKTNIAIDDAKQTELMQQCSQLTATILGKPEGYVMVMMNDQQKLIFGGNDMPAAYIEFKSINLPEDQTSSLSQSICESISDATGIAANRIYIEFANAERHLWGWNNATF